jgi:hypothetical protein
MKPSDLDVCLETADFPKLAEKLSVIRTDRHEDLVRPKNILLVRKKSPIVLAIGHLISPLVLSNIYVLLDIRSDIYFEIVGPTAFLSVRTDGFREV